MGNEVALDTFRKELFVFESILGDFLIGLEGIALYLFNLAVNE